MGDRDLVAIGQRVLWPLSLGWSNCCIAVLQVLQMQGIPSSELRLGIKSGWELRVKVDI